MDSPDDGYSYLESVGDQVIKKPLQIWIVFSLSLALVVAAMVWLSFKTMQVEQAREQDRIETELARREAELLERISSAMYRMDWMLSPLVAQEAARPYQYYRSFYRANVPVIKPDGSTDVVSRIQPSPLLFQPSEFVLLHFQLESDGQMTSPQAPTGDYAEQAISLLNIDESSIQENQEKLELARAQFNYHYLVSRCPVTKLPDVSLPNFNFDALANNQSVYGLPPVGEISKQQLLQAVINENEFGGENSGKILAQQKSRLQSRGTEEFLQRRNSTENYGWNQLAFNNEARNVMPFAAPDDQIDPSGIVNEGVMRPVWINNNLLLARRVEDRSKVLIQCCWLDWDRIQSELKQRVDDLLTEVDFQPVETDSDLRPEVALATLPVQLIVDNPKMLATLAFEPSTAATEPVSGLRLTLLLAWSGLGIAAMATAFLLQGVLQLSERRAAFVSAVTHELRTPLTTFRMYSEMLAEKMVPPERQQQYAQTLKVQADRLSLLVENVLQFAKLERGPGKETLETLSVGDLFDAMQSRLEERAAEADMNLSLEISDALSQKQIRTRSALVEQILFNLVDNACKYAKPSCDNRIRVTCSENTGRLKVTIRDFGPGVSADIRTRMFQPFCKSDEDAANSAPGVGLGLALCRRMAESLGGQLSYRDCDAASGGGAEFVVELPNR